MPLFPLLWKGEAYLNTFWNWTKEHKIKVIFYLLFFLLSNYVSSFFSTYTGTFFNKLNYLTSHLTVIFEAFPIALTIKDLGLALGVTSVLILLVSQKEENNKTYRKGVEHGSATWGNPKKDLEGMFNQKDDSRNILFSENIRMAINNEDVTDFKAQRNKNALIIGGSGSGKTRFFVKPNIMQLNADFVVTDPKGSILNELGVLLRAKENYDIRVLNLIDFSKSMHYNPLAYIKKEEDILKVVETIIKNTSAKDAKEDFWVTTEKLIYQALIAAILNYFEPEERHLGTLVDLLALFEVKENDEDYISTVDQMFLDIEASDPDAFCVKQYNAFKLAAGETAKSILISCATRLAPLNIPAVRDLLSTDEMKLEELGNKVLRDEKGKVQYDKNGNIMYQPVALFVIIPDSDTTFNFISSIMYTQMFNTVITIADTKYNGSLPRPIRCLFDEFANTGQIPNFEILIATIRSRNISATPILQTLSQLKKIYKDSADTIVGNCDTLVFLGGKEESTLKMISGQLGKGTIDDFNTSRTRSQNDSFGQNYSKLGRELMTPDEIQKMDRRKAIVMITSLPPFMDNKYDITNHPNYQYHGQAPVVENGKIIKKGKYWFDTDRYITSYRNGITKTSKIRNDYKEKNDEKRPFEFQTFLRNLLNEIVREDPNFKVSVK